MIAADIKGCRNCGNLKPERLFGKRIGSDVEMYRIVCRNCDNASEIFDDEAEMIEAWNYRKPKAEFDLLDSIVDVLNEDIQE